MSMVPPIHLSGAGVHVLEANEPTVVILYRLGKYNREFDGEGAR